MVPREPEAPDSIRPSPAPDQNDPRPAQSGMDPKLAGSSRLFALALVAGITAGAASWFAGEFILDAYKSELNPNLKSTPDAGVIRKFNEARIASATRTFGAMGGILGLTMGLAGGLARRSPSAGIRSAVLGLLFGVAAVSSTALVVLPIFFKKYDPQSGDLVLPLLTHSAIWSAVGAIGGLAFGLGLGGQGRWKATLVGGLVGGAAATIIYEIVGAVAFATSKTELPLSSSITTRGIAHLLVPILTAIGAIVAGDQSTTQKPSPIIRL